MHITRALIAPLAATLALTVVPSSAGAAVAPREAKPQRVITVSFAQVRDTEVAKFTGTAYKLRKGKVYLQKKVGKNKWKRVDTDRTGRGGKYVLKHRVPRSGKKTVFRVTTRADKAYARSYSPRQIISWS